MDYSSITAEAFDVFNKIAKDARRKLLMLGFTPSIRHNKAAVNTAAKHSVVGLKSFKGVSLVELFTLFY